MTLEASLNLLLSTLALGCPVPLQGLLTTASAMDLAPIPNEAPDGPTRWSLLQSEEE